MSWTTKHWFTREAQHSARPASPLTASAVHVEAPMHVVHRANGDGDTVFPISIDRKRQRTRNWRRRALLRKGARLYSTIPRSGDFVSLAMLDEDGVVIGWYERGTDAAISMRSPSTRHVSQLYIPQDVALGIPMRELCNATIHGESIQAGWRLGVDGVKFWATTTIRAVLLRDGRLQGYSHVTHRLPAPRKNDRIPILWRWTWPLVTVGRRKPRTGLTARRERAGNIASRYTSAAAAAVAVCVALAAPSVDAALAAGTVPNNATARSYGTGWDCEHGFQRVRDACVEIRVPANAYLDPSGERWRCDRGYISADDRCIAIKVPANAFLDDAYGSGWRCERRFRELRGECARIEVPANAHEVDASYGPGWECNYGYVARQGLCDAIRVPANGYLTRSGETWKCDRGFVKTEDACRQIQVPEHAYLDARGDGWACNRGFRKAGSSCAPVEIPPNAHVNYAGDGWRCDRGFVERGAGCARQ